VINTSEPDILIADFRGLNQGDDELDVHFGQWVGAVNSFTNSLEGELRTRNGFMRVSQDIYSDLFAILPGAAGGRVGDGGTPLELPHNELPPDYQNFALKLVAVPTEGFANAGNPLTVTFLTYGGTGLGISTYNWDYSYNGGTPTTDASGSATSTTHDYTAAGTYICRVWGTGSDSIVYHAEVSILVHDWGGLGNPVQQVPPPPKPPAPPKNPPGGGGGPGGAGGGNPPRGGGGATLRLKLEAEANPKTINSGDNSQIQWRSQGATAVFVDGVNQNNLIGFKVVAPTSTTIYQVTAINAAGKMVNVPVTVTVDDDIGDPWIFLPDSTTGAHNTAFEIIVYSYKNGGNVPVAFSANPVLLAADNPDVTSTTITGPVMNGASTEATFTVTVVLKDTDVDATVDLTAKIPDTNIMDDGVAVIRGSIPTLTVLVVDDAGNTLSSSDALISSETAMSGPYLKISGAGVENDVTVFDAATGGDYDGTITFDYAFVSWSDPFDAENAVVMDSPVIPANVFLMGGGTVTVSLIVSFDNDTTTDPHYATVQFSAAITE